MIRKILTQINNQIVEIVKDAVIACDVTASKNVSDQVFSRDGINVGINTTMAPLMDIQNLIADKSSKYEDGGILFDNNRLVDGVGFIGIETLITVDSGNQSSSQDALSENAHGIINLYNYFMDNGVPSEWKLYELILDIPS